MSTYYAILTAVGEAKIANAHALGENLLITHMAVGDGNGNPTTPDTSQTALVNERRRAPLNTLNVDPQNPSAIIAEQVIPESIGGWWIRELGLFDEDGDLVAVANCPDTYKPVLAEGSGRTQVIRMVLIVSSAAAVQLKIDPSIVLATRSYVDDQILSVVGIFSEHVEDKDNPHWVTKAQIGLGSVENYPVASQAESEAGDATNRYMTPKRVIDSLRAVVSNATESVRGTIRIATNLEVGDSNNNSVAVTPAKLRIGFSILLASSGYVAFPSWLGGLIIQWGGTENATSGTITFPLAWPTAMRAMTVANQTNLDIPPDSPVLRSSSLTQIPWERTTARGFLWIAIGY